MLEHRWRTNEDPKATQQSEKQKASLHRSRTTRLTLVDLAGSESTAEAHGGVADKVLTASVLINHIPAVLQYAIHSSAFKI